MRHFEGTLVLVAKLPRRGKSKTRPAKDIDEDGALKFARACVMDLVERFALKELETTVAVMCEKQGLENCTINVQRVVLTPADDVDEFCKWLHSLGMSEKWKVQAIQDKDENVSRAGKLGVALGNALLASKKAKSQATAFIGMDTPQLCLDQVASGFSTVFCDPSYASISAASDGGYVLLVLPCDMTEPALFFDRVNWSTGSAFATQVRAITNQGKRIRIGDKVYVDVDDLSDLRAVRNDFTQHMENTSNVGSFLETFNFAKPESPPASSESSPVETAFSQSTYNQCKEFFTPGSTLWKRRTSNLETHRLVPHGGHRGLRCILCCIHCKGGADFSGKHYRQGKTTTKMCSVCKSVICKHCFARFHENRPVPPPCAKFAPPPSNDARSTSQLATLGSGNPGLKRRRLRSSSTHV